jgi:hypothetical protein
MTAALHVKDCSRARNPKPTVLTRRSPRNSRSELARHRPSGRQYSQRHCPICHSVVWQLGYSSSSEGAAGGELSGFTSLRMSRFHIAERRPPRSPGLRRSFGEPIPNLSRLSRSPLCRIEHRLGVGCEPRRFTGQSVSAAALAQLVHGPPRCLCARSRLRAARQAERGAEWLADSRPSGFRCYP